MGISSHIDEFNKLIVDLLNLDETFKDDCKTMLLIGSLPDDLHYFYISLIHGKDKLYFEEVFYALLNNEIRKKDKKEHRDESMEALTVSMRSRNKKSRKMEKSRSQSRLSKDVCAFCYEKGNWKKDCPKLKNKDKSKVIYDACDFECIDDVSDYKFCLVVLQSTFGFVEWILDTSCTYHVCPHKNWFFNFEEVDGGVVYMGSGDVSYIIGIGSI